MRKTSLFLILCCALTGLVWAVRTKTWVEDDYTAFEKGQAKRLSLRSDGRLSLSPRFAEIWDSSTPYLWALAQDSHGNIYTGGGGPGATGAKVYQIEPGGKARVFAGLDDLEVHALAVDKKDQVYAGTSPGGRIYRIPPGGKPQVVYAPNVQYIWALAFASNGDLFAATGDKGEIHRITPDGKGAVFFKTGETHARSLAVDANDNLIVGTEPGGLILRVSPKGEGFVLYQGARREVTSVMVASDNTIYAAAVGTKQPSGSGLAPLSIPLPQLPQPGAAMPSSAQVVIAARPLNVPPPVSGVPGISGGSEVYRIDRDGFPRKVWSNSQDIVYAVAFDSAGHPLIATGNKGLIYRLDSDQLYTLLVNTPPTQVTSLYAGREGKIYAATGNVGKVYQIGPGLEKDGYIESDVFDAGIFSYWGRAVWRGELSGGKITLATRSGNLDRAERHWSPWAEAKAGSPSPSARFLQWRATLALSGDGRSPELDAVEIAYQGKNVNPVVSQVEITPPNYRFPAPVTAVAASQTLTLPPLGRRASNVREGSGVEGNSSVSMQQARGYLGARWSAGDENSDRLVYRVEIRGIAEKEWKLLKDKVHEKYLSWDSTAFPDGRYVVRVTASDAPSNPPAEALSADLVSAPFLIDNSPPAISNLTATRGSPKLEVRWHAADALSVIGKAEYSVDGGAWLVAEPATRLSDSPALDYTLSLDGISSGEHTIAVRVTDEYGNQAVAKTVVR